MARKLGVKKQHRVKVGKQKSAVKAKRVHRSSWDKPPRPTKGKR